MHQKLPFRVLSEVTNAIRSRLRRSRFHVARRVGPKTLVKTYVKPKSAPAIHYEPAPAPVVHETYVEPAPLPVVHRRRKPIPTVRRIEIPVEKEYHYVEPAPAPAPVAVHKTYVEPAPVAVETYADPAPVYVEEPAYAVAEPAPLPGITHRPNNNSASIFFGGNCPACICNEHSAFNNNAECKQYHSASSITWARISVELAYGTVAL